MKSGVERASVKGKQRKKTKKAKSGKATPKQLQKRKSISSLRAENHTLRKLNESYQSKLTEAREKFESLVRVVKIRIVAATSSERQKLLTEKNKYDKLIAEARENRVRLEEQLSRFDALRSAYIDAFGEMRVKEIERQAIGAEICPRCNGLGGAHADCPVCSGNGWRPI